MRKRRKSPAGGLIRRIRKPIAPPMRVEEDELRYHRERERERMRREAETAEKVEGKEAGKKRGEKEAGRP